MWSTNASHYLCTYHNLLQVLLIFLNKIEACGKRKTQSGRDKEASLLHECLQPHTPPAKSNETHQITWGSVNSQDWANCRHANFKQPTYKYPQSEITFFITDITGTRKEGTPPDEQTAWDLNPKLHRKSPFSKNSPQNTISAIHIFSTRNYRIFSKFCKCSQNLKWWPWKALIVWLLLTKGTR
jgi:hypothetical protein